VRVRVRIRDQGKGKRRWRIMRSGRGERGEQEVSVESTTKFQFQGTTSLGTIQF
jgi:hypothetical protein